MYTCSKNESIKTLTATMEWNRTQRNTDERMPVQFQQTITTLIEALIKPKRLKRDLFFVVLLLFMKENGFMQLKGVNGDNITILEYILSQRDKVSAIYEMVFVLNGFTGTPLKVIFVPISDVVLINVLIPDIDNQAFSLCLDIDKYIATSTLGVVSHFQKYQELSLNFIDKIVTPAKCAILHHHGYPSCNLPGLPEQLIHQILFHLPVGSVVNIAESCKYLKEIVDDDRLWRRLYERDFSDFVERKNDEKDWRDTYIELYLIKRRKSEREKWFVSNREFPEIFDDMDSSSFRWQIIL